MQLLESWDYNYLFHFLNSEEFWTYFFSNKFGLNDLCMLLLDIFYETMYLF